MRYRYDLVDAGINSVIDYVNTREGILHYADLDKELSTIVDIVIRKFKENKEIVPNIVIIKEEFLPGDWKSNLKVLGDRHVEIYLLSNHSFSVGFRLIVCDGGRLVNNGDGGHHNWCFTNNRCRREGKGQKTLLYGEMPKSRQKDAEPQPPVQGVKPAKPQPAVSASVPSKPQQLIAQKSRYVVRDSRPGLSSLPRLRQQQKTPIVRAPRSPSKAKSAKLESGFLKFICGMVKVAKSKLHHDLLVAMNDLVRTGQYSEAMGYFHDYACQHLQGNPHARQIGDLYNKARDYAGMLPTMERLVDRGNYAGAKGYFDDYCRSRGDHTQFKRLGDLYNIAHARLQECQAAEVRSHQAILEEMNDLVRTGKYSEAMGYFHDYACHHLQGNPHARQIGDSYNKARDYASMLPTMEKLVAAGNQAGAMGYFDDYCRSRGDHTQFKRLGDLYNIARARLHDAMLTAMQELVQAGNYSGAVGYFQDYASQHQEGNCHSARIQEYYNEAIKNLVVAAESKAQELVAAAQQESVIEESAMEESVLEEAIRQSWQERQEYIAEEKSVLEEIIRQSQQEQADIVEEKSIADQEVQLPCQGEEKAQKEKAIDCVESVVPARPHESGLFAPSAYQDFKQVYTEAEQLDWQTHGQEKLSKLRQAQHILTWTHRQHSKIARDLQEQIQRLETSLQQKQGGDLAVRQGRIARGLDLFSSIPHLSPAAKDQAQAALATPGIDQVPAMEPDVRTEETIQKIDDHVQSMQNVQVHVHEQSISHEQRMLFRQM